MFQRPPPLPSASSCLSELLNTENKNYNEGTKPSKWIHGDEPCDCMSQFVMFNLSFSIPSFYVLTQLNSLVDWTQLVKSYNLIQLLLSEYLSKTESYFQFLIPTNYLDSGYLPFISTWKMVKDAHNHIPMNMIVLFQTSHETLKDGYILIFPVVLITPKAFRPSV